jgi:hypothetical protein
MHAGTLEGSTTFRGKNQSWPFQSGPPNASDWLKYQHRLGPEEIIRKDRPFFQASLVVDVFVTAKEAVCGAS